MNFFFGHNPIPPDMLDLIGWHVAVVIIFLIGWNLARWWQKDNSK